MKFAELKKSLTAADKSPSSSGKEKTAASEKSNTMAQQKPLLIILGNEEHGISDIVKQNCDELVIIPWAGMNEGVTQSAVDSLNVAQAASIIFYEMA